MLVGGALTTRESSVKGTSSSAMVTCVVRPGSTWTSCWAGRYPSRRTTMRYRPGSRCVMRHAPSASVVARQRPTLTSAAASGRPAASITRPSTSPRVWANPVAGTAAANTPMMTGARRRTRVTCGVLGKDQGAQRATSSCGSRSLARLRHICVTMTNNQRPAITPSGALVHGPLLENRPNGGLQVRVDELGLKNPLRPGLMELEARGRRGSQAVAHRKRRSGMGCEVPIPRHRPIAHAIDGEPVLHVRAPQDIVGDGGAEERVIGDVIRIHAEPDPIAHGHSDVNGATGGVDHIRVDPYAGVVAVIYDRVHHVDATEHPPGLGPEDIAFHQRAWRAEDDDSHGPDVCDRVVPYDAVGARHRDAAPESGPDLAVLGAQVRAPPSRAVQGFEQLDGGPAPRLDGFDVADHLARSKAARQDKRLALGRPEVGLIPIHDHIAQRDVRPI